MKRKYLKLSCSRNVIDDHRVLNDFFESFNVEILTNLNILREEFRVLYVSFRKPIEFQIVPDLSPDFPVLIISGQAYSLEMMSWHQWKTEVAEIEDIPIPLKGKRCLSAEPDFENGKFRDPVLQQSKKQKRLPPECRKIPVINARNACESRICNIVTCSDMGLNTVDNENRDKIDQVLFYAPNTHEYQILWCDNSMSWEPEDEIRKVVGLNLTNVKQRKKSGRKKN
jgi:hypothetical protein